MCYLDLDGDINEIGDHQPQGLLGRAKPGHSSAAAYITTLPKLIEQPVEEQS